MTGFGFLVTLKDIDGIATQAQNWFVTASSQSEALDILQAKFGKGFTITPNGRPLSEQSLLGLRDRGLEDGIPFHW